MTDTYDYNNQLLLSPKGTDTAMFPPTENNQCLVRFLHAAANEGGVHISIGSKTYVEDLEYGNIYPYQRVEEGIKTVQVIRNDSSRMVLYKKTMAFRPNAKFTLALVNTQQGIGIKRINDVEQISNPRNLGSLRVVNLSYQSDAYDLVFTDNRIIFSDVHYLEITRLKYGRPDVYQLYLSKTPEETIPIFFDMGELNDLLTFRDGYNYVQGYQNKLKPILYLDVDIKSNTLSTIYIIGNYNESPPLEIKITQNR